MSIKGDVIELESIRTEIKRLSASLKTWRAKEKALCEKISNYLNEKDLPGVKFGGVAILNEQKEKRKAKPKGEGISAAMEVLKRYVPDPEKVLEEMAEAKKGEAVVSSSIKIQKLKGK